MRFATVYATRFATGYATMFATMFATTSPGYALTLSHAPVHLAAVASLVSAWVREPAPALFPGPRLISCPTPKGPLQMCATRTSTSWLGIAPEVEWRMTGTPVASNCQGRFKTWYLVVVRHFSDQCVGLIRTCVGIQPH